MARSVPTIKEVAAHAGVSTATVSYVLKRSRPVSERARAKVLDAVAALGYRPNGFAARLRTKESRVVGLMVPDIANAFFSQLTRRLDELAVANGYQIMLINSAGNTARESQGLETLLTWQAEGAIVVPGRDELATPIGGLSNMATVVVDRIDPRATALDQVGVDNQGATFAATRYLLEAGHGDIALLVSDPDLTNVRERIAGYRTALSERDLGDRAQIVVGGMTPEQSATALAPVLEGTDRPTAVFATNSDATLGAMRAARAAELEVPRDLSLVGFDDAEWMAALRPGITTVRQPIGRLAEQAWTLLQERLSGHRESPRTVRLPCRLTVRESVQAIQSP